MLEICVDSFESAQTATRAGANRLEICQNLSVGGLTPTAGFVSVVKKSIAYNSPVFVLIRPRPGNFVYNSWEIKQMIEDIKISKEAGADGFVFGALDEKFNVDSNVCQQLLTASSRYPVTFHRAFDQIIDKRKGLEDVINLGFDRILTSGGSETAVDGVQILHDLICQANKRIIIMPGGGVSEKNIINIRRDTGAKEFHSSARTLICTDTGSPLHVCSRTIIRCMKSYLDDDQ